MNGMLGQLDEHSIYLSPKKLAAFHEEVDLQFAGIGIEIAIDPKTKQLMVLSPLANSPAAKAGILAGDQILRIGKTATQGMSLTDAFLLFAESRANRSRSPFFTRETRSRRTSPSSAKWFRTPR